MALMVVLFMICKSEKYCVNGSGIDDVGVGQNSG